jgi:hypothetical protein
MQQTIVLPYMRPSGTRSPRRDMVITRADSLSLTATIVESDDPSAQTLILTGGIGGPAAMLLIWPDYVPVPGGSSSWGGGCGWDYGWGGQGWGGQGWAAPHVPATILWSGQGTPTNATGSFDFFIPVGAMASFPHRCGWAIQLGWDGGLKGETLASGIMHVSGPAWGLGPVFGDLLLWTTDGYEPITTDTGEQIFV